MKPAGFLLLLIPAGLASVLLAEEAPTGLASKETKARIREGLPTWQPKPPPQADATSDTDNPAPTAAGTLVLPKMTVEEKRLPPDAADHLMSRRDLKRKMENIYLDEMDRDGPLNYLLNSITIPLFSPSKADRGRAIYRQREIERLGHVTETGKTLDPKARKTFKKEIDNTWTIQPPARK